MPPIPFLLQTGQLRRAANDIPSRDFPTSEDPLSATVEIDSAGCVLEKKTRITAVEQETLDDA